jgi:very-short-patch-repair endonuclease
MTLIYNKSVLKERRRDLRRNQTEVESALWGKIRNKSFLGLKFFRQYSVGPYIIDFYCPRYKLAIELDGGQHSEEKNKKYDEVRTHYLESVGIEVMRFWNNDVLGAIEEVLEQVKKRVVFSIGELSPPPLKTLTPLTPLW